MMPSSVATPVSPGPPRNLRWTVDQFHYLGDLGMFEGRRAMLIDGVIVEEGPMNPPHAIAGEKTEGAIRAAFGTGWRVRVQKPLVLGQTTDPEPDVAVVRGTHQGTSAHPTTAELVVEISDTSLHFDTTTKAEWYAAGIPDYWVLDVSGRRLLVLRDPAPVAAGGAAYRTHLAFGPTDSVSPLAAPRGSIAVADLLP
ncbi:MAG TPA: Uma2 family endonuclease [Fimbriiglobus sp.]|nr:Uma2 family endonuclease [Fimbriiglobus sp.]